MNLFAAPPDVIRWSPRSAGNPDCAVAALEIACGVTYEIALGAAISIKPDVLTEGLTMKDIKKAAALLGFKGKIRKKYDLDEDTGILGVGQPHVSDSGHVVYLWEGRIIEPANARRQMWLSAPSFISHYKYQPDYLLTLEREEEVGPIYFESQT